MDQPQLSGNTDIGHPRGNVELELSHDEYEEAHPQFQLGVSEIISNTTAEEPQICRTVEQIDDNVGPEPPAAWNRSTLPMSLQQLKEDMYQQPASVSNNIEGDIASNSSVDISNGGDRDTYIEEEQEQQPLPLPTILRRPPPQSMLMNPRGEDSTHTILEATLVPDMPVYEATMIVDQETATREVMDENDEKNNEIFSLDSSLTSRNTHELSDMVVKAAESSRRSKRATSSLAQLRLANMKLHGREEDMKLLRRKLLEQKKEQDQ